VFFDEPHPDRILPHFRHNLHPEGHPCAEVRS
jgi:hypothetical protein